MCGVCGIVWSDPARRTPDGLIRRMTRSLAHRGPDGEGIRDEPGVSLGHRRLSVIDLAAGAQPLGNEDGTVWVVFNGEIYNHGDLRGELQRAGHRFATRCDTEVLVHGWEEWGERLCGRLRGMFAFALWDARDRTLLLARDRLGQKPLVYRHDAEGIRFASELKALLADPRFPREVDWRGLDGYLAYQYVPTARTIFAGTSKLPPGCYAVFRGGRLRVERYWKLLEPRPSTLGRQEAIEAIREKLTESVRLRLMSDVPLGAFLSGGVDSSIVVALMAKLLDRPVRTFSIGFPVPEYDERNHARLVAQRLGTEHEEFVVEPDALGVLEKLSPMLDEPFADSSIIPTWYVSEQTRRRVTVALSGDAGDELFAGYERYRAVAIGARFDRLPRMLRWAIAGRHWQRAPVPGRQKSRLRKAKRLLEVLGLPARLRYRELVLIFGDERRRRLYDPDGPLSAIDGAADEEFWRPAFDGPALDGVDAVLRGDLRTYLPCDILHKVDTASMLHGLECRGPMLDHEFVELACSLPTGWKLTPVLSKLLLKEAFADELPESILGRAKMGFGVPLDHWFRAELRELVVDTLTATRARSRGWFRAEEVDRLIEEHLSGRWDHAARLWALLMLERWAVCHLDGSAARGE